MPNAHVIRILVEDEFLAFLVDRVVSKMHANVFHVVFVGHYIVLSGKSGKPLPEYKYFKRVYASDENVDSQVELQPLYQVRLRKITLYYTVLLRIYIL